MILDKIKLDIRITHNQLNEDIQDNIEACFLDLKRVGIKIDDSIKSNPDALLTKCIKLYMRWQYNFENQGDRYRKAYELLRDGLSLDDEYRSDAIV